MGSKFNFAVVISVIVTLIYSYFVFMGAVYWCNGDWLRAMLLALGFIFMVVGCVMIMCMGRAARWKSVGIAAQVMFGLIALVILLLSAVPFSHFFSMMDKKQAITDSFEQTRTYAEGIENAYSDYIVQREEKMNNFLNTVEAGKGKANPAEYKKVFGKGATKQNYQEQFNMLLKLSPADSIAHVRQMAWLNEAAGMSIWNINTPKNLAMLNEAVNKWLESYVEKSKNVAYPDEGYEPFSYQEYNQSSQGLTSLLTSMEFPPVWWSIIIALVCFGCILLPYFLTDTSRAAKGKSYDNQEGL